MDAGDCSDKCVLIKQESECCFYEKFGKVQHWEKRKNIEEVKVGESSS